MDELQEIKEKLAAIESILQRLPELEAKKAADLWVIPPPSSR